MSEPESIERLLRRSMTARPAPALSANFEQRLANRLKPRRLRPGARNFLLGYAVVGIAISFWAMLASGMNWRLSALAIVVPAGLVGAILRPLWTKPKR